MSDHYQTTTMSDHYWMSPLGDFYCSSGTAPLHANDIPCDGRKLQAADYPYLARLAKGYRRGWPYGEDRGYWKRLLRREPEWINAPDLRGRSIT